MNWVINLCLALSLPDERSAIALHLPQLCRCICSIWALGAGGMQGFCQPWQEQGQWMCLSTCGCSAAWKLSKVPGLRNVSYDDELLRFSAVAVATDFCTMRGTLTLAT